MRNILNIFTLNCLGLLLPLSVMAQKPEEKHIEKNGMTLSWHFSEQLIHFEMQAPTQGWVTIGFNTHAGIQGAYLLMGRIKNGQAEVVEHHTLSPGNYRPIVHLGGKTQVQRIRGEENNGRTKIQFSLPIHAVNKYQKDLREGLSYTLILAYSTDDDFQHHSHMRTSISIQL